MILFEEIDEAYNCQALIPKLLLVLYFLMEFTLNEKNVKEQKHDTNLLFPTPNFLIVREFGCLLWVDVVVAIVVQEPEDLFLGSDHLLDPLGIDILGVGDMHCGFRVHNGLVYIVDSFVV